MGVGKIGGVLNNWRISLPVADAVGRSAFFVSYVVVKDSFVVLAIIDLLEGLEGQANFFDGIRDIVNVEVPFLVLYISYKVIQVMM